MKSIKEEKISKELLMSIKKIILFVEF